MYKVKLLAKKDVADGTMAFWFSKPEGYAFLAGQHTGWTLINPLETDAEGDSRDFSFASAPFEDNLMIASRMRDTAFKRVLHTLPVGSEIQIGEPEGHFVLHSDTARAAVFLAGGIGITPFRSLVFDAISRQLPHKFFLFYSNREPKDAAFLDELRSVTSPNYKFISIFTYQSGHLTMKQIKANLDGAVNPVYYIAGPPKMVLSLRELLTAIGVDDLSVKIEDFEGY